MADLSHQPICGHLERGDRGELLMCTKPHHAPPPIEPHTFVLAANWLDNELRIHAREERPVPRWMWWLAGHARSLGSRQLLNALENDDWRRVQARRAQDRNRSAAERPFLNINEPDVFDAEPPDPVLPPAGGPVGNRPGTASWERVRRDAPDAWRSPDDAGRSVRPQTPGPVPVGVEGTPLGRPRGESVSSVEEVKASCLEIENQLREARGLMEQAAEIVRAQGTAALGVLAQSAQETAQTVIYRCRGAEMNLDDALSNSGIAVEECAAYGAGL